MKIKINSINRALKKSSVKVFFLGGGQFGSWQIRGMQISMCRSNWSCGKKLNWFTLRRHDVFVIVKKTPFREIERIKKAGKILVYDIVDSWKQPRDSLLVTNLKEARSLFGKKWSKLNADSYIFPNQQMEKDLGDLVPHSTYIYHHYFPLLKPKAGVNAISTFGYQGDARYLNDALTELEKISTDCNLQFLLNPELLSDLDIGIIMRSGDHNGFLEKRYKSNVKLVNLMACGIVPVIQNGTYSCHEIWGKEASYFSSLDELKQIIRMMKNNRDMYDSMRRELLEAAKDFEINKIVERYEAYFEELKLSINSK